MRKRISATMNDIRNRAINWVLVEKPAVAAKVIRKLTAKGSKGSKRSTKKTAQMAATRGVPAPEPGPLTRNNGLRAANVAARVPGAR